MSDIQRGVPSDVRTVTEVRLGIGGNSPPSKIQDAQEATQRLGHFLKINPAIDHTNATEAAALIDTSRRVAKDLDDERDGKVRPLNDQVAEINAVYHVIHNENTKKPGTLDKLLTMLKERVSDFARREERRREREAEVARRIAEEAEKQARAAEEAERRAAIDQAFGAEVDIAAPTAAADQAFSDYQRLDRAANRAERDTPVRLATPMGRAVSLRTHETLHVDDWHMAIRDMGLTAGIAEAILTAARAYRKLHDKLPAGVRAETERGI